jgi:hypothetical protein
LLNTVDLLNAKKVVITLDAIRRIEELWGGRFVRRKNGSAALVEVETAEASDPVVEEVVETGTSEAPPERVVGEAEASEESTEESRE